MVADEATCAQPRTVSATTQRGEAQTVAQTGEGYPVARTQGNALLSVDGGMDFGSLFPGHGGMMDRLDSVYWATVVMYIYLNLSLHLMPAA